MQPTVFGLPFVVVIGIVGLVIIILIVAIFLLTRGKKPDVISTEVDVPPPIEPDDTDDDIPITARDQDNPDKRDDPSG